MKPEGRRRWTISTRALTQAQIPGSLCRRVHAKTKKRAGYKAAAEARALQEALDGAAVQKKFGGVNDEDVLLVRSRWWFRVFHVQQFLKGIYEGVAAPVEIGFWLAGLFASRTLSHRLDRSFERGPVNQLRHLNARQLAVQRAFAIGRVLI